jgi:hypothetical protein
MIYSFHINRVGYIFIHRERRQNKMTKNTNSSKISKQAEKVTGHYSIRSEKKNSVSYDAKWTSLSKKVLKENIGAWETLSKE